METRDAAAGEHQATWTWFEDFLSNGQQELETTDAVCPFVRPSIRAGMLRMQTVCYDDDAGLEGLCALMRRQIEAFAGMSWPAGKEGIATLVTVIDGMPAERRRLLDEAQRRVKGEAVRRGYMIGQFHPDCAEPAALAPKVPISRAPEPLFAIRRMAVHDIRFLHADPALFAEYRDRFGHHFEGERAKGTGPDAELYALALQRGKGRGAYNDYQSIDVLLSLQNPRTDHPSEMAFYISGQAKELLFKAMYEQARAVRLELVGDRVDEAIWGLRRITATLDVLSQMWSMLSTLAPTEFNTFREQLGTASGVDSCMFRMAEFALGRKSESLAARYAAIPGIAQDIYRELRDASVYDEALLLLARRGFLTKEQAEPATRDEEIVTQVWADIYRTSGPSKEEFRLAEALMDVAEHFGRWRALHLLTAERMIGLKPGTGGTQGSAWLRCSFDHRFFPELWAARTMLPSGPAPF